MPFLLDYLVLIINVKYLEKYYYVQPFLHDGNMSNKKPKVIMKKT